MRTTILTVAACTRTKEKVAVVLDWGGCMTTILKIITNTLGDGDWMIIALGSDTVYEGHSIAAIHLVDVFTAVMGMYEKVKFIELTDEQIQDWQEHV